MSSNHLASGAAQINRKIIMLSNRIKTPLRYPGGKSRIAETIYSIAKRNIDFHTYCEPFVGGGSVFSHFRQDNDIKEFYLNDLNEDLISFYCECRDNSKALMTKLFRIRASNKPGRDLFYEFLSSTPITQFGRAIKFFVLNRSSFSGLTEAGRFSQEAFDRRFTLSSIERIKNFGKALEDTIITGLDYRTLILPESCLAFFDPPYDSQKDTPIYGHNGKLHREFDKNQFVEYLSTLKCHWICTYNSPLSLPFVTPSLGYVTPISFTYGNNVNRSSAKRGNEYIITSFHPK